MSVNSHNRSRVHTAVLTCWVTVGPLNFRWSSPAQYFLVSGVIGIHNQDFLSFISTCLEVRPPLQREDGSDYYWSLPLYWEWLKVALTH
jgi:hypothetical protein